MTQLRHNGQSSNYVFLVPKKLIPSIQDIEPHLRRIPGYSKDRLLEIFTIIAYHARKDDVAILKMEVLKKFVPRGDEYLKVLRDLDVIVRVGAYTAGEKSFGYRFADDYLSEYDVIPIKCPKLLRRLSGLFNECEVKSSLLYPGQWKFLKQITILDEALDYIEKYYKNPQKKRAALSSFCRIKYRTFHPTVDDTSNRYHSPITNIPRELRQFLRVNNQPLVGIDVKTCQPFILVDVLESPAKYARFARSDDFKKILKSIEGLNSRDFREFKRIITEEDIYIHLLNEFRENGLTQYKTRKDVKKVVMRVLFASNYVHIPERKIFEQCFPTVGCFLKKLRGPGRGSKFEKHGRLAILLQTIEAEIIMQKCLLRINKEYPEVITLTVFDSIYTGNDASSVELVESVMIEEFEKFTGNLPRVSRSY